jgi:D-sedoheptulose 7-phosphate isomerase
MSFLLIDKHLSEHESTLKNINHELKNKILKISDLISEALKSNNTVYWIGNGGSATDSLHISGELVGRFRDDRKPLRSICLCSDVSAMTCISNDYGYENVFSRQIQAHTKKGDVVVGISTSGNSLNIQKGIEVANYLGAITIGLLGKKGGNVSSLCHTSLVIDSNSTMRIQEMHITIGHIICDLIEQNLKLKKIT